MPRLDVVSELDDAARASVLALLETALAVDGHPVLSEQHRVALLAGSPSEGFAGVLARDTDENVQGYAQVLPVPGGWALEVVTVAPDTRRSAMAGDLVRAALGAVASRGGGRVHLWRSRPTADDDAVAEAAGFVHDRDLYQMRRPLPVDAPVDLDVRAFVPGVDEEAWLAVNNRAFAGHPEQGGWDRATLAARLHEPWFDAEGFLLHERDGRLAGFVWTKVHADEVPPAGEIYVIAVDPDFAGSGLGRDLVLAGLDHLARRGLTVGMLYVDAANTAAVRLYENLGFTVDHVDRAWTTTVDALSSR